MGGNYNVELIMSWKFLNYTLTELSNNNNNMAGAVPDFFSRF